jgi:hypothetical protein
MSHLGFQICGNAILLVCFASAAASAENPPPDREKDLLRQRRDALKAMVEVRRKTYDAGRATAEDMLGAVRQLLLAEAELADKPADLLALCDRFAPIVKEASDGIEALYKARMLPEHHYALRRAAVREAEVALARQRLKAQPSPENEKHLRKVLLARLEAYKALLWTFSAEIEAGRLSHLVIRETYRRALQADRESKDNPADHFRMLQQALDQMQAIEDEAKDAVEAGRFGKPDFVAVRIARLSVAIDLARARLRDPDSSPKVKKLLVERRDLARELKELIRQQRQQNRVDDRFEQEAAQMLLEAELPLAETAADRLALLRGEVDRLKKDEEDSKKFLDAGRIPADEYQAVQAARLAAEINLARAQRTAK